MNKAIIDEVVRVYSLFGLKHAAKVVERHFPDMTHRQAYDLAHDIIFEFVS